MTFHEKPFKPEHTNSLDNACWGVIDIETQKLFQNSKFCLDCNTCLANNECYNRGKL